MVTRPDRKLRPQKSRELPFVAGFSQERGMTGWQLFIHFLVDRKPRNTGQTEPERHHHEAEDDAPWAALQQGIRPANDRQRPRALGAEERRRRRAAVKMLNEQWHHQ